MGQNAPDSLDSSPYLFVWLGACMVLRKVSFDNGSLRHFACNCKRSSMYKIFGSGEHHEIVNCL